MAPPPPLRCTPRLSPCYKLSLLGMQSASRRPMAPPGWCFRKSAGERRKRDAHSARSALMTRCAASVDASGSTPSSSPSAAAAQGNEMCAILASGVWWPPVSARSVPPRSRTSEVSCLHAPSGAVSAGCAESRLAGATAIGTAALPQRLQKPAVCCVVREAWVDTHSRVRSCQSETRRGPRRRHPPRPARRGPTRPRARTPRRGRWPRGRRRGARRPDPTCRGRW